MAYIKIFPIKVTDKKALDYITNPDKTDEKILVSSFGCSPETADLEFALTRENAKKNGMDKGDNLAFHLIQSFKPGEIDAETAHRLGEQFADEVLKGKYEYVISTHVDKDHIHNHIILNSVSFETGKKFHQSAGEMRQAKEYSNQLCREHGLSVTEVKADPFRIPRWKRKLRQDIRFAMENSRTREEFIRKMETMGYRVKWEPGQKYITYTTEDNVRCRDSKLFDSTLLRENMELYFAMGGAAYLNTYQIAQTDEQHNGRRPAKHGDRPAEIRPTEQRDDGAGQHDESHHKRQRQAEHKPYTLVRHGRKSVHLAERQQIGTPRQHHHAQRSDHRQHDLY